MSVTRKRTVYSPEFKAKVGLEALRGVKTIDEIGQEYGVHPVQVGQWKKEIQEQAKTLFEGKRGPKPLAAHREPELLYSEIGKLKVELDWLKKKVRDQPAMIRQGWIDPGDALAVVQQCALAGVSRATVYAQQKPGLVDESDLLLSRLIDEEFTRHPFYGSRKMVVFLKTAGHLVNRKRVQRLMRRIGLAGMAPGPNTSRPHPEHKAYPYLLRGVPVVRPNQVWSTDITYLRLPHGFAYLVAIIDWYSRRVLRDPVARAWYLATGKPHPAESGGPKLSPEFLEEIFELRMAAEDTPGAVRDTAAQLRARLDADLEDLFSRWERGEGDLSPVPERLSRLKYVDNLLRELPA